MLPSCWRSSVSDLSVDPDRSVTGKKSLPTQSEGIGVRHLLMSRRRTGAIAIGVGAATAVVLSLVGAKTQVVIGSAAALGVAGGVVAGGKGGR